jgi:Zn-dependent peptidase ImmA (M78 family)
MDDQRKNVIEDTVRNLQLEMWAHHAELLPGHGHTRSPFDMLHPWLAAHFLNLKYIEEPALDRFGRAMVGHEVAGFVDRSRRLIAVSTDFDSETRRFTGAHEICHFLLHPNLENLHRDRPIKGMSHITQQQPIVEREANFGGGCFLMPRKLVEKHFKKVHGCAIADYRFTESEAWRLRPNDSASILQAQANKRNRAVALANYRLGVYQSLARCFDVSPSAMAIRLEELSGHKRKIEEKFMLKTKMGLITAALSLLTAPVTFYITCLQQRQTVTAQDSKPSENIEATTTGNGSPIVQGVNGDYLLRTGYKV